MKTRIVASIILGIAFAFGIIACQTLTSSQSAVVNTDLSAALNGVAAVGQAYVNTVVTPAVATYITQGAGQSMGPALAAAVTPLIPQVGTLLTQSAVNAIFAAANPPTVVTGT